ncbi:reverse transcriptase [Trichonephila clavipes]|nr:reverse transcriptase [Trichonephila clavipes]
MLDVTKYPPSAHGFTCRNCGGGDRGRVAIYRPFGEVSLSLNRTVTCMVLKANDRRTSCPCYDEFRGPRSDYVRQWVPSHVGISGNEKANQKAKQEAAIVWIGSPLDPQKEKCIIPTCIDKCTTLVKNLKSLGKSWEILVTVDPILRRQERAETVACFRLSIRRVILGAYLHWHGLATDEMACPLCGHARMDGDHLLQCTGFDEFLTDDVISRYWEV